MARFWFSASCPVLAVEIKGLGIIIWDQTGGWMVRDVFWGQTWVFPSDRAPKSSPSLGGERSLGASLLLAQGLAPRTDRAPKHLVLPPNRAQKTIYFSLLHFFCQIEHLNQIEKAPPSSPKKGDQPKKCPTLCSSTTSSLSCFLALAHQFC